MNRARWLIGFPILLLISCADPQGDSNNNNNNFLPSGQWIQNFPDSSPSPRIVHAMTYDTFNQRVILFGGRDASGFKTDTWIYNPMDSTWEERFPTGSPSVLNCPLTPSSNLMVYDTFNQRVVHFGLLEETCSEAVTRVYDVADNSWSVLMTGDSPQPRRLAAMVYVLDTLQVILFGGETEAGLNNETWAFDLLTDTWQEITPSVSPSPRGGHKMVYDSFNDTVTLFGGETEDGTRNNETWLYDVFDNTWNQSSSSVSPSARSKHDMVYDTVNRLVLLFGGFTTGSAFPNNETWVYDYTTDDWIQLQPAPSPDRRFIHAMVYASDIQEVILFGGAIKGCGEEPGCVVDSEFYKDDTWNYIRD
jgi:hypothetical protein